MSSNSYAVGPRLDVGDGAARVADRGRPASERRGPAGTCAPSGEGLGSRDAGSARQALAARLALRIGEAVDAALVGVSSSPVAGADDEAHRQLLAGWREVLSVCLKCGLAAIELGKAGDAPAIVAVQAERAARLGVGVSVGIGRYHLAYETAWDFVVEEVSAMPLRDEDRTALMAEAALASASLLANVLAAAATAHAEELQRRAGGSRARKQELVMRVLSGQHVDTRLLVRLLEYDLDAWHLGVIVWGDGAAQALELLAQRLGRRLLALPQTDGTVWGWIASTTPLAAREIERRLADGMRGGVAVAAGRPAFGAGGFIRTHRQAQAALSVARRWPRTVVTLYGEVASLAQALRDGDYEAFLIDTYITPLGEGGAGSVLRKTLIAYYAAELDRRQAAKELAVERHTLSRRLTQVETLIGRPLVAHHAEMQAALKLAQLRERSGLEP